MQLGTKQIADFRQFIWDFYSENERQFTWRNNHDPYAIVVSEIMLQQTQTYRVEPKYEQFLVAFPTFQTLATASLRDVLSAWQGLGYNRRGRYLQQIAQRVVAQHSGTLPNDPDVLVTFPGLGPATAASICAFAFNMPVSFIETNVRAVFLHCFFKDQIGITDKQIMPLVTATVDQDNAREWYYALMDYGVYLKKQLINPSRRSAHHTKQSKFEGSNRQIRGMIIKLLTDCEQHKEADIASHIKKDASRVSVIINQLVSEQLIVRKNDCILIAH